MDFETKNFRLKSLSTILLVGTYLCIGIIVWLNQRTDVILKETARVISTGTLRKELLRNVGTRIHETNSLLSEITHADTSNMAHFLEELKPNSNKTREAIQALIAAVKSELSKDYVENAKAGWVALDDEAERLRSAASHYLEALPEGKATAAPLKDSLLKSSSRFRDYYVAAMEGTDAAFERQSLRSVDRVGEISSAQWKVIALLFVLFTGIMVLARSMGKIHQLLTLQERALSESAKGSTVGSIAGTVAFEMDEPLNRIRNSTLELDGLLGKPEISREACLAQIANLMGSCEKVGKFQKELSDLIDSSKSERPQDISLNQVIENIACVFKGKLERNGVTLQVMIVPENLTAHCNPQNVARILGSLLSASIERLDDASDRWIKIEALSQAGKVMISVIDSSIPAIVLKGATDFGTSTIPGHTEVTQTHLYQLRSLVQAEGGKFMVAKSKTHTQYAFTLPPSTQPIKKAA